MRKPTRDNRSLQELARGFRLQSRIARPADRNSLDNSQKKTTDARAVFKMKAPCASGETVMEMPEVDVIL
jgi:hypothetical protein